MQEKPNYKVKAVVLIICGIVSVILGIVLINVASEASPYSRQEREAVQLLNIFSICMMVNGVLVFIGGCVSAGKAANESSNNNGMNSGNNYNSDYWRNNSGSANSGFWKCPKCGRINANYVGTCGCSEVNPDKKTDVRIDEPKIDKKKSQIKFCFSCGESIEPEQIFCGNCGTKLDL